MTNSPLTSQQVAEAIEGTDMQCTPTISASTVRQVSHGELPASNQLQELVRTHSKIVRPVLNPGFHLVGEAVRIERLREEAADATKQQNVTEAGRLTALADGRVLRAQTCHRQLVEQRQAAADHTKQRKAANQQAQQADPLFGTASEMRDSALVLLARLPEAVLRTGIEAVRDRGREEGHPQVDASTAGTHHHKPVTHAEVAGCMEAILPKLQPIREAITGNATCPSLPEESLLGHAAKEHLNVVRMAAAQAEALKVAQDLSRTEIVAIGVYSQVLNGKSGGSGSSWVNAKFIELESHATCCACMHAVRTEALVDGFVRTGLRTMWGLPDL